MPLILIIIGSLILGSTFGSSVFWGVFLVSLGISMHSNRD